jgi:hypothetical protein
MSIQAILGSVGRPRTSAPLASSFANGTSIRIYVTLAAKKIHSYTKLL